MLEKIKITGQIEVVTGLHIGASDVYAAIGAANSPVVRDPMTQQPIIPGSSLKGKMRTLLVKSKTDKYVLEEPSQDPQMIVRLFGCTAKDKDTPAIPSRLQFVDCFLSEGCLKNLPDSGATEVKTENTITRATGQANPRSMERIVRGTVFDFNLFYTVERFFLQGVDAKTEPKKAEEQIRKEIAEDFETLADGIKLLQQDYLGGHGTRGSGRIAFSKLQLEEVGYKGDLGVLKNIINGGKHDGTISV